MRRLLPRRGAAKYVDSVLNDARCIGTALHLALGGKRRFVVLREKVSAVSMVRWIEQHGHAKQAAGSLDTGPKLTRSLAMPERCGAMDFLLRLDLHELTSNRRELGRRIACQPDGLPGEQRLPVLGKALEAAPVRSCDLDLSI